MVDVTEAMESQYLTADLVKESESKTIVIIDGGKYEDVTYDGVTSKRLSINVELDMKAKIWRPNKDSVSNLAEAYGKDSDKWVGKQAKLSVVKIHGKNSINAVPFNHSEEKVE